MHLTAEIWRKSERRQRLALALVAAECESRRRRDMSDRLRASSLAGFFLARRGGERRRATTLSWCRVVPPTRHPLFGALWHARALCVTPQLGNFLFNPCCVRLRAGRPERTRHVNAHAPCLPLGVVTQR